MPATPFRPDFKRTAKRSSHQVERVTMHWRHVEKGWEVVSPELADEWDNATHPEEHDGFTKEYVGELEESVPRYTPDDPDQWEGFFRETTRMPEIFDKDAHNQLVSELADMDYLNAESVAEFLNDAFTAEYPFDNNLFKGTGRHETCSNCNGTGTVCGADECSTYCQSESHDATYVSDPGCSCSGCNYHHHQETCDVCDGEGKIFKESFTRTFPQGRGKLLSEKPSTKELQVIQYTVNKLVKNDKKPSPRQVLKLFDTVEYGETEDLIHAATEYLKPVMDTTEVKEETESGQTVTVEKPDPAVVRDTKVELTSTLVGISEKQAQAQVSV